MTFRSLLATVSVVVATAGPAWAEQEWGDDFEEVKAKSVSDQDAAKAEKTSPTTAATPGRSPIDGVVGHIGVGYFTGSAPLGARYWLDRNLAVDLGLDGSFSSGDLEGYSLGIEVGGLYGLAHYHYSVVFARAGAGFRYNDLVGEHSSPARYDINANVFLGAELFLGAFGFPNISLQGGYGVQANWVVEGGSTFRMGAATPGLRITSSGTLGFHIYL